MIVRIMGEGQYRLSDELVDRVNQLDNDAVAAVEADDEAGFHASFVRLLDAVRSGDAVGDDSLVESDVIIPPADTTFAEAAAEFTGDGLVPDDGPIGSHTAHSGGHEAPSTAASDERTTDSDGPFSARLSSDLWTVDDELGYGLYADAIADFVQQNALTPPLTIGINAPWGAGKTSLMRMVRARLDPTSVNSAQRGQEGLGATHADLLTVADSPVGTPISGGTASLTTGSDAGRWPTVWFDPWRYQTENQVWAGLADSMIRQLTGVMSRKQRETFFVQLSLRRVNGEEVRRRVYTVLIGRLLPAALASLCVAIAALGLYLASPLLPGASRTYAGASGLSIVLSALGFAAAAGIKRVRFLREPITEAFSDLVEAPDYAADVGFLHRVHADIDHVLALAGATAERPVVVFVDDLDRCSWRSVTQVVEALNLFLAGVFPNCIFIVAMDPSLVAAQLEVAYRDLCQADTADTSSGKRPSLGWRFMEKFVQLPLSLPPPEQPQLERFVARKLGTRFAAPSADHDSIAKLRTVIRDRSQGLEDIAAITLRLKSDITSLDALYRAAELQFHEAFTSTDVRIQSIVLEQAQQLSRNPREIKRFINVFRFYFSIQLRRRIRGLAAPDYEQLAKIAQFAVRWPQLVGFLGERHDGGMSVLDFLEQNVDSADGEATYDEAVAAAGFPQIRQAELLTRDFRAVLERPPLIGGAAAGFL